MILYSHRIIIQKLPQWSVLLQKPHTFKAISRCYTNRNVLRLHKRGVFQDMFPDTASSEITDLLNAQPQTVYAGFDPTADSLHVGNLLVLMSLLHWQRAGHQVIALVGSATAQIGDPSGRSIDRPEINKKLVHTNADSIKAQIERIFENHEKYFWSGDKLLPVITLNNEDWYKSVNSIDFISQIARHFRMGDLLSRSSVKDRLKSPSGMSCAEFTYQMFQSYDWLYLLRNYSCTFQIGGNDQLGNIKSGHDLIGKLLGKPAYGLTVPLITTENGEKLGKSAGNAIWLANPKTKPFDFYQYWVRQKDTDAIRLLKLFTFLDDNEIERLESLQKKNPAARPALTRLAQEVTKLIHGESAIKSVENITKVLYSKDQTVDVIAKLDRNELEQVFSGARTIDLLCEPGITVLDLSLRSKCFTTEQEAVRIIDAGGFYINQQRVNNLNEAIVPGIHILPSKTTVLRTGKKNYCIVKWLT